VVGLPEGYEIGVNGTSTAANQRLLPPKSEPPGLAGFRCEWSFDKAVGPRLPPYEHWACQADFALSVPKMFPHRWPVDQIAAVESALSQKVLECMDA